MAAQNWWLCSPSSTGSAWRGDHSQSGTLGLTPPGVTGAPRATTKCPQYVRNRPLTQSGNPPWNAGSGRIFDAEAMISTAAHALPPHSH